MATRMQYVQAGCCEPGEGRTERAVLVDIHRHLERTGIGRHVSRSQSPVEKQVSRGSHTSQESGDREREKGHKKNERRDISECGVLLPG